MAATRSNVRSPRHRESLRAGELKHGFRIISRLGTDPDRGVFLAAHEQRGDLVVLKHARKDAEGGLFDRIIHEHEVLSGLSDSSIRTSLRIQRGREGLRTTDITMLARFVDGSHLGELEDPGVATVLKAAIGAARGLAHAHEQGIVHGRIDPDHILVEPGGEAKLIGFGSSIRAGATFDPDEAGCDVVAPERHLGGVATARTDIFGLAASIWSVLGDSPLEYEFAEDLDGAGWLSRHEIWTRQVERADLPAELASLLVRCLHPDPLRRPAFVDGVRSALERIASAWSRRDGVVARLETSVEGGETRGDEYRIDPRGTDLSCRPCATSGNSNSFRRAG